MWRLTAPVGHRVRVVFTDFSLDQHTLGHCNELVDHVRLIDGGTTSSQQVGLYCGRGIGTQRLVALSTSRDLLIQFHSDRHSAETQSVTSGVIGGGSAADAKLSVGNDDASDWHHGFHAWFYFEPTNGTVFDDGGGLVDSRYIDVGGSGRRGHADQNELQANGDGTFVVRDV
jgi:hypothetical protein